MNIEIDDDILSCLTSCLEDEEDVNKEDTSIRTINISNLEIEDMMNSAGEENKEKIVILDKYIKESGYSINNNKYLIGASEKDSKEITLHTVDKSFKYSFIKSSEDSNSKFSFSCKGGSGRSISGIIQKQYILDNFLYSFVPFTKNKKVIGWFKKHPSRKETYYCEKFFHVPQDKELDEKISSIFEIRDIMDKVSEEDLYRCYQKSNMIYKQAQKLTYVYELMDYLMNLLHKTSDPIYVLNVMKIYHPISIKKKINGNQ